MEKWVAYAFVSMFFAGFTSVIAKMGLAGISGELGLTIRTLFVCGFVLITALSWIFYYKALKAGDVATVALIDKGSVVVAMLLAWLVLREVITLRMVAGAALIVAGLLVIAKK